ncbi:Glycosyl transferase family 2 [Bryocella elongata]|uniref:Glycosyl transferase family 2 n=1 Tax=Bryocella elongata TaxID=863522 RepID=A0A1H5SQ51_9BACT|nr:glycosyltransferase family 2 protein [Bryocella elongata]SEF52726.1 Glycosyl transferase family 2 [Bryocella elongata]
MKPSPIVSVVIPTRGRPETVCVAVRSALAQSFESLEVLVVIDGEDGETEAALARIDDARLKVLSLPEPMGAAAARNGGVRAARGPWIAFLDDDDEWLPEKLALQLDAARGSDAALPVVCGSYWARQDGRDALWGRRRPGPDEPISEYMFCRRSLTYGENALATSVLLVPRELMERVPFDAALRRHQDWDWALRALALPEAGLVYLELPTSIYNMAEGTGRISAAPDWQASLAWVEQRRPLLTRRAFAGFLATECVTRAVQAKAGRKVVSGLLRRMFSEGEPDLRAIAMVASVLLLPPGLRSKLRDAVRFMRS